MPKRDDSKFSVKRLDELPLVPTDDPEDFHWYPVQHHLRLGAFGVNGGVGVTVSWDISWYQYRITPESGQPVRLAERGHEPRELESMFTGWNARLTRDGRIVPDISRV